MITTHNQPFLYLNIEAPAGESVLAQLKQALGTGAVGAVLIQPPIAPTNSAAILKPLIALTQQHGVAALLASEPALARQLGADGVHVPWSNGVVEAFGEARDALVPPLMVGADAGRSRHEAMQIGEGGADYVAFGIPAHVEDRERARERRLELVSWWAEIFEIPMVAFDVETPAEAADLIQEGADFIAITLPPDIPASGIPAWISSFSTLHPTHRHPD